MTRGAFERAPSGIPGLDQALGGGLPSGRSTLVVGSPGAGKTLFALQALATGARGGDPGVLLTFEESPSDLLANVATFGWAPRGRAAGRLCVLDGRHVRTAFRSGDFDLTGLLSSLGHRCGRTRARRVVLDGLDVLLDLIDDPALMRREVYRLADWLQEQGLTAVVTAKSEGSEDALPSRYAFLPFLADCVLLLQHRTRGRTAMRGLRVLKCRGVAHSSNEMPMVVSSSAGLEVLAPPAPDVHQEVHSERVSSGVERLDAMLHGGYFRGTCTLISGAPGTSKTSLAGAFVEAACARGERSLFVSFDEAGEAIVRNLASVDVRLGRFVRSGLLRILSAPSRWAPPEAHVVGIRRMLEEHEARCLVVDPVSALTYGATAQFAEETVLALVAIAKGRGVTSVLTSLLEGPDSSRESTAVGISTIADTWMHVSYLVSGGERNRALTIIKSRGTGHSNQVRELVLSDRGLTLEDVYTAGGAVLMGTLRWEKEKRERAEKEAVARTQRARRREIAASVAELESRMAGLRAEVERRKAELYLLEEGLKADRAASAASIEAVRRLRHADPQPRRRAAGRRGATRRRSR